MRILWAINKLCGIGDMRRFYGEINLFTLFSAHEKK
jgi:hypothetical protein